MKSENVAKSNFLATRYIVNAYRFWKVGSSFTISLAVSGGKINDLLLKTKGFGFEGGYSKKDLHFNGFCIF